jgi:L-lactate dehydrogenase complex protein LldF
VFREIGGHGYRSVYPGPIGSVISAGFFGPDFLPLAQASSLCGACREACPVDIDLPKLLTRVRAGEGGKWKVEEKEEGERKEGKKKEGEGLSALGRIFMQIYSRVARSPRLFISAQKLAAWGTRLLSPRSDYLHLPAFTGWGYSKDFPRFAGKTFRERFAALREEKASSEQVNRYKGKRETAEEAQTGKVSPSMDQLASQFIEELKKVNGEVICTRPDELTGKVIELLKARQIDAIHLEPGLLDAAQLQEAGITISYAPEPGLRAGVTHAVCGLADTGSILVVDGEGQPLLASLLPAVHIAVLHKSDMLPSLPDALALPIVAQARSAVVITGPSRTADIEMSLTIGMHGPGELHVFLVQGTASTRVRGTAGTRVDD